MCLVNVNKYDSDSDSVMPRTPVRHCELNIIKLIWAQAKGYVAQHNTSFNIKDVESLYSDAIKKVSSSFTEQKENVGRQQLQVGPWFEGVYS